MIDLTEGQSILYDALYSFNVYRVIVAYGINKGIYVQDCADSMTKDYAQDLHGHVSAEIETTPEGNTELRELLESIVILTDRVLEITGR